MASSDSSVTSGRPAVVRATATTACWTNNSSFPCIPYAIDSWSSFSANFRPDNILVDAPHDSSSRWSGAPTAASSAGATPSPASTPTAGPSTGPLDQFFRSPQCTTSTAIDPTSDRQWLCIKLDQLSLVDSITFGKTAKQHPCNIKDVDVFYGPEKERLVHGLRATLRNDSEYESFPLKAPGDGQVLPCRYIKIVPISSHSHNYNSSVWFFAVQGNTNEAAVEHAWHSLAAYKERKTLSMMLKHLRQRGLMTEFEALRSRVARPPFSIPFEHPLVSRLHQLFVAEGNFDAAETCMAEAANAGLFDRVLSSAPPRLAWQCMDDGKLPSPTSDADGESPKPRGGHQLVFVPASESDKTALYLYGGFDGQEELDDFWKFELSGDGSEGRWHRFPGTPGPGPRSCHKMCLDEHTGIIYLLGRYIDTSDVSEEDLMFSTTLGSQAANDLWAYDTHRGKWELLDADVSAHGGPKLLHDLQMVVDAEGRGLWVFGGRHAHQVEDSGEQTWSGLYRYNIDRQTWTLLRNDTALSVVSKGELISRHGHSMLFDPAQRKLLIFGGQRNHAPLTDLWTYSVDTKEPVLVSSDVWKEGGPPAAFTQRGIYDAKRQECRFFAGHTQIKRSTPAPTDNCLHTYSLGNKSWTAITPSQFSTQSQSLPEPRFAHQFVFDPNNEIHYLFGGTAPDEVPESIRRLNDLWSLKLNRITGKDLLKKAKLLIRRQKFYELCTTQSHVQALTYLQTELSAVIQGADEPAQQVYRECMHFLLSAPPEEQENDGMPAFVGKSDLWEPRTKIFEKLLQFFPPDQQEPAGNLADLVVS